MYIPIFIYEFSYTAWYFALFPNHVYADLNDELFYRNCSHYYMKGINIYTDALICGTIICFCLCNYIICFTYNYAHFMNHRRPRPSITIRCRQESSEAEESGGEVSHPSVRLRKIDNK